MKVADGALIRALRVCRAAQPRGTRSGTSHGGGALDRVKHQPAAIGSRHEPNEHTKAVNLCHRRAKTRRPAKEPSSSSLRNSNDGSEATYDLSNIEGLEQIEGLEAIRVLEGGGTFRRSRR